jgi:hypothetical protein
MLDRSAWSHGRDVLRAAQRFQELVADGSADGELVVRVTLTRGGVDDPLRAMHEAQMLRQVLAKLREAAERYEMPETAAPLALEQSVTHHARDRAIRSPVVRELKPGGVHDPEALDSSRPPALSVCRNPRIRPGVDKDPAGRENPVNLA